MFEPIIEKLNEIIINVDDDSGTKLKEIIEALSNTECSNGMFCGLDKTHLSND